jgi:hypothetical protein
LGGACGAATGLLSGLHFPRRCCYLLSLPLTSLPLLLPLPFLLLVLLLALLEDPPSELRSLCLSLRAVSGGVEVPSYPCCFLYHHQAHLVFK